MSRLFIPACGDRLVLTKAWDFTLYLEYRNVDFAKLRGLVTQDFGLWDGGDKWRGLKSVQVSLPAETTLECDRVYVRSTSKARTKEEDDYDSVTWRVVGPRGKPLAKQRFWTKLPAVYDIEYRLEPDGLYRDRVKAVKSVLES